MKGRWQSVDPTSGIPSETTRPVQAAMAFGHRARNPSGPAAMCRANRPETRPQSHLLPNSFRNLLHLGGRPNTWSPPALERRKWLVEQARDYATNLFPPHPRRHQATGKETSSPSRLLGRPTGLIARKLPPKGLRLVQPRPGMPRRLAKGRETTNEPAAQHHAVLHVGKGRHAKLLSIWQPNGTALP